MKPMRDRLKVEVIIPALPPSLAEDDTNLPNDILDVLDGLIENFVDAEDMTLQYMYIVESARDLAQFYSTYPGYVKRLFERCLARYGRDHSILDHLRTIGEIYDSLGDDDQKEVNDLLAGERAHYHSNLTRDMARVSLLRLILVEASRGNRPNGLSIEVGRWVFTADVGYDDLTETLFANVNNVMFDQISAFGAETMKDLRQQLKEEISESILWHKKMGSEIRLRKP